MKTIKWIIAAVLLGTMASCSEDSMEIPEEPATVKFTDAYSGDWNIATTEAWSFKIGSTVEALRASDCIEFEKIVITINEGNHLVFYGYYPDSDYRVVFDVRMSPNLNGDGNAWGNMYIQSGNSDPRRNQFTLGSIKCN